MAGKLNWSPAKKEAVRRELLEEGKTLKEIAVREGATYQAVHYQVGALKRGKSRSQAQLEKIQKLVEDNKSDDEISEKTGLTIGTVRNYRGILGIKRPNSLKQHTQEHSIWCALKWNELFGYTPAATDWNPSLARQRGYIERAERFNKFRDEYNCPTIGTIQHLFLSWSEFIRETGLPPAPQGYPARGHWAKSG